MTPWLSQLVLILAGASSALVGCTPVPSHPVTQIPEELLIGIQTAQNVSQFFDHWVNQDALERAYLRREDDDDGDDDTSASEVEVARPAGCIPDMQVVEFDKSYDPSVVFWPTCTRVRRCSGCCSSKMLQCVPTRTSTLTVKVIKARYPRPGAEMLDLEGYETKTLVQHDRCACQCRQQAEDCGPLQRYQPGQCRCVCQNQHEAKHCTQTERYWDAKDCSCRCRREVECSTGSTFNNNTCRCETTGVTPTLPDYAPGPAPHLKVPLRDDGGENDAYRLRYATLDSSGNVGPFEMSPSQSHDQTVVLDNATESQRTEN